MPELIDRDAERDHVVPEEQQMGPEGDMELGIVSSVKPTDCSIPDERTLEKRLKTRPTPTCATLADCSTWRIGRLDENELNACQYLCMF